jgi:hypothetical protein
MENLETILESLHQIEAGLADAVPTDDTRQVVASTSQKHVSKQGQDPSTKIKTKTHKVKKDVLETIQNQNTSLSGTISTPVHIAGRTLTHEEQNAREKVNFLIRILQENIDDSSTLVEKEQQWLEGPESKNDIILGKKIDLLNLHLIEIIDATSRFQQSMENFIQLIGKNIPSSYENINGDDIDVVMEKCNVMKRKILLASEEVVETIENLIRTMTNYRSTDADTNIAPADTDVPPGSGSADADEEIEPADDGVHDSDADVGPLVYVEPTDFVADPPETPRVEDARDDRSRDKRILDLATVYWTEYERIHAWFNQQVEFYINELEHIKIAFKFFEILEGEMSFHLKQLHGSIEYLKTRDFLEFGNKTAIDRVNGYIRDIETSKTQITTECETLNKKYGPSNARLCEWKDQLFEDEVISELMGSSQDNMEHWIEHVEYCVGRCVMNELKLLKSSEEQDNMELTTTLKELIERKSRLHENTTETNVLFENCKRTISNHKSLKSNETKQAVQIIDKLQNAVVADFIYTKIDSIIQKIEKILHISKPSMHTRHRQEENFNLFHTQLVAFTQALLAAAYPPAPAASFDARPQPVAKRSVAASFPSAACPALHALCARVAHITGVAKTHPKIAAARFALEIAERAALVRVALAQARAVLSAAPPSTRVVLNERFAALNGCLAEASIRRVLVAANAASASAKHHGHGSEHTRSSSRKQKHSDDEQERFTDKSETKVKTEKLYADGKQIHYVTAAHAPAQIKPPAFGDAADMANFMRSFERELDEAASGSEITNASRAKK